MQRPLLRFPQAFARVAVLAWIAALAMPVFAQLPIGDVALEDATVTGSNVTEKNRAILIGNVTVTAKDRVGYVQLYRGGTVKVCATSGVHLTSGTPVSAPAPDAVSSATVPPPSSPSPAAESDPTTAQIPLLVALDRGALEMRLSVLQSDVLMTPDLRFAFSESGPLDLRVRVTRNGDTCVENRVAGLTQHPALEVSSLFGSETYNVLPGQHVLFERADLHEVVDNESSPCGCPEQPARSSAQVAAQIAGQPAPPAVQYPFPAAVSQGLAPPPEVPQAAPGVIHTQVATTLVYPEPEPEAAAKAPPAPSKPATSKHGFFHGIGHFFKRAFGSSEDGGPGSGSAR